MFWDYNPAFTGRGIIRVVRLDVCAVNSRPRDDRQRDREAQYLRVLEEELKAVELGFARNPRRQDLRVRAVAIRRELKRLKGKNG